MKITRFLDNMANLPENVQRLANRAVLYTALAVQNTEAQMRNESGHSVTQVLTSGGALSSMRLGVVNEQTQAYTKRFKQIMEQADRVVRGADGSIRIDETTGRATFLTEGAYKQKRADESRSKTDLRDDFPIELDWQCKKTLLNETYLPGDKKEFYMNIAIDRTSGGMVKIEDHLVAAHVKVLPSWSSYPKLLEFYTSIQRPMPQFDGLSQGAGLRAVVEGMDMVMLTQASHQGEEIYGYNVLGFDKVVEHNGQLCYKFFVTDLIG